MSDRCAEPIDLGELAAYRLRELNEAAEQAVEEHFFACAECTERLSWLEALSRSVIDAVRAGRLSSNVSAAWVARAASAGVRVRSYEITTGTEVECTVAPDDDFVIVRLRVDAPVTGPVDVETEMTDLAAGASERRDLSDAFVDPDSHELIYAFSGDVVRTFPRSRWVMHVRPRSSAERIGPFTMDHTPWSGSGGTRDDFA